MKIQLAPGLTIKPSSIHGKGCFATVPFQETTKDRGVHRREDLKCRSAHEERIERCCEFAKLIVAGVWTAVAAVTARTTSITRVCQTRSCRSFTITYSSSPCAISKPGEEITIDYESTLHSDDKRCICGAHFAAARSIRSERANQSRGSVKLNLDPRPSSESSSTRPPCCSTTSRTNDSPSPVDSSSFSCPSRTTR